MDDQEQPPRVLVVDDDENVLRLLAIKLRRAGFTVDLAPDAAAARDHAQARPPDLVLLGDSLPDGDGLDLAVMLGNDGYGPRPGIVVLSGRSGPDDIRRAVAAGVDDYVLKPFSPQEVAHRLQVVLLRRRLHAGGPR